MPGVRKATTKKKHGQMFYVGSFFFVAFFPLLLLLALFLNFPRLCEMHVTDIFTYILRKLYFLSEAHPMAGWNSILVEHFWSVNFQVWLHN